MKALWKGSISFGLITFPIKLYAAINSKAIGFRLLHAKCKTPLKYQRYCPHCKKVVAEADIVKGIELPDGSFFTITKEKLNALKPERSNVIEIVEFVDTLQIAPIYFDDHYYVAPHKVTEKAYLLFVQTLKELSKVAIGKFVFHDKEYVCAIQSYENGLLLSTLNYAYEIRPMSAIEELSVSVSLRITKKELSLAQELVKKMSKKIFDIKPFKDTFASQIKEQVKHAAAGKKLIAKRARKAIEELTVPENLLDALQKSLKKVERSAKKERARA